MLITYTNGERPTSMPARRHPARRRLTGTAHRGPHWTNAVVHRAVSGYRTRPRTPGGVDPPPQSRLVARSSTASTSWTAVLCTSCKSCSAFSCAYRSAVSNQCRGHPRG